MCLAFGMRAVNYWKEGCLTYVSISPKPNYSPVSARMSKPAEEAGAEGRARGAFVKFEVKFRFRGSGIISQIRCLLLRKLHRMYSFFFLSFQKTYVSIHEHSPFHIICHLLAIFFQVLRAVLSQLKRHHPNDRHDAN